jgi:hypothetical protein
LSAEWAYPGAKVTGGGRSGLIDYYAIATTTDDIGQVIAHYQPRFGDQIPVEGISASGAGSEHVATVAGADRWSAGKPGPFATADPRRTSAGRVLGNLGGLSGRGRRADAHRPHARIAVDRPHPALALIRLRSLSFSARPVSLSVAGLQRR